MKKTEKPWGKTHLLQVGNVFRHRVDREGIAGQLITISFILRQQLRKPNPSPTVCYALVLTKGRGKETWALPEILPRLLTTIWQRKAVWKTLFQNKPSGTFNPVYLPRKLLNNTKNVSINKTLSITTLAQYFYPATLEEHPINNNYLHRVLFWKSCSGKKRINSYTRLGVVCYWRASSWPTSETYTCYKIICS